MENKKLHLAHYFRFLWEAPGLIVVTGEAREIWNGRAAYNKRYALQNPDARASMLLNRLFAAAGLAAVVLPEREWWGWSLSLPGSSIGFFCGVEPEGMVCGRVLGSEPSKNLAVVQRQAKKLPATQSHFTLLTQDPVEAVERYFEEAEQTLIRIAVDRQGRGVLLRPMPGGGFDEIQGLSDDDVIARCFSHAADGTYKQLDEVLLFYECPCNEETIKKVILGLPRKQGAALWGDLDRLDVECPRCGRHYTVKRTRQ